MNFMILNGTLFCAGFWEPSTGSKCGLRASRFVCGSRVLGSANRQGSRYVVLHIQSVQRAHPCSTTMRIR